MFFTPLFLLNIAEAVGVDFEVTVNFCQWNMSAGVAQLV
jgi:hypothetical protein